MNCSFNELLASVDVMDKIAQGKKAAARVTQFPEPQARLIRYKDWSDTESVCHVERCQQTNTGKLGTGTPTSYRPGQGFAVDPGCGPGVYSSGVTYQYAGKSRSDNYGL